VKNNQTCQLQLFITTYSTSSQRAIRNIKALLSENPGTNIKLEIIDIFKEPAIAIKENIIAVPLLVKKNGAKCQQKLVGDMSNCIKFMEWLAIKPT
jgi:circadian clock protein KaiB